MRPKRIIALLALVASVTLVAGDLWGQQRPGPMPRREGQRPDMGRRGPGAGPQERPLLELFQRIAKLPPAEQGAALEREELYQRMPPMMRERFLQRLDEFNALPEEYRRQMMSRWEAAGRMQAAQQLFLRVAPLAPEEQQQTLAADEFFQRMPPMLQQRFRRQLHDFNRRLPEERQQMLERFRHFSELAPEEQEQMRRRARLFARMSPEQRQQAEQVFRVWQQLPPERRQIIIERLRAVQQSPFDARAALLNDDEFLAPLDDNERRLLRGLWELRGLLPPAPPAPRE